MEGGLSVGGYQIFFVEDGPLRLDGGAMFGVIPRPLWERKLPPDSSHRVSLALRCMLLLGRGRRILVDTGMGGKWSGKEAARFGRDEPGGRLLDSLASYGLVPEDITDVILTHLHFDHAGGATRISAAGRPVPTFPRARYCVQRRHLDWATAPSERDAGSFRGEDFLPLLEAGCLDLLDGQLEIFEGIGLLLAEGHTVAQQLVLVEGSEGGLLFPSDLVPTHHHLHPAWGMAYDLQPVVLAAEKRRLLERAAELGWWLAFEHDPQISHARIQRAGKGWQLRETENR